LNTAIRVVIYQPRESQFKKLSLIFLMRKKIGKMAGEGGGMNLARE
jgi:hypothetical protein